MANPYIPRREGNALGWMKVFAGTISTDPARYGLSPADATAIQNAVDAFGAAYTIAADEARRTKVTVRAKDNAFVSARQIIGQFYSLIKPNAGISDADKIAIGVRPVNRDRTPIGCPQSSPLLAIIGATPGAHTLRYHDSFTPESSRKPFGATELQLFVAVDESSPPESQPPNGAEDAKLVGKFTRNPIGVDFTSKDGGKVATYYARWVSRRGETGPWSGPVRMHIAA